MPFSDDLGTSIKKFLARRQPCMAESRDFGRPNTREFTIHDAASLTTRRNTKKYVMRDKRDE